MLEATLPITVSILTMHIIIIYAAVYVAALAAILIKNELESSVCYQLR